MAKNKFREAVSFKNAGIYRILFLRTLYYDKMMSIIQEEVEKPNLSLIFDIR
jgi:hypothetical protein